MIKNHLPAQTNNKKLIFSLVLFALFATGLSLIFFALTPLRKTSVNQTEFMTTNFDQSKSTFKSLKFTSNQPTIPEKLPIAEVKLNPTIVNQMAQQLIEKYNLHESPNSKNIWVRENYSLFRDEKNGEYIFNNAPTLVEQASESALAATDAKYVEKTVKRDAAIRAADSFIQSLFPQTTYLPARKQMKFFRQNKTDLDDSSEANATLIEIPFSPHLAEFPVFNGYEEYAPIRVMLNAQNEIIKCTIQTQILETVIVKQVATITVEQAIANILAGQGSIISAYQNAVGPLDLAIVRSGTLEKAVVEYRTDLETGLAFPVYRFSGKISLSPDTEAEADIITPAIVVAKTQN